MRPPLRRFGLRGAIRGLQKRGAIQGSKLLIYELLRPVLIGAITTFLRVSAHHTDLSGRPGEPELGQSVVFARTGLIYSHRYGFQCPWKSPTEHVADLVLKQLAEMSHLQMAYELLSHPLSLEGSYRIVINQHYTNYYHLLFDSLYVVIEKTDEGVLTNRIQSGLLERFDREFNLHLMYDVLDAMEVCHVERALQFEKPPVETRARALRDKLPITKSPDTPGKIYIAREATVERRVVNQSEVYDVLRSAGYQIIVPEELGLIEVARAVKGASSIISVAGAGLANLIWADDARVVILHPHESSRLYAKICMALGLEYTRVECQTVGPDLQIRRRDLCRHI
jgi:hypothetical protein